MEINEFNNKIGRDNELVGGLVLPSGPFKRRSLAKKLLFKGENHRNFEVLRLKILQEIIPQTEIENILCEKIISTTWKLQRAMIVERNILSRQNRITGEEKADYFSCRKRVRNIKRIRLDNPDIQYIIQYQLELEKNLQKTLIILREEQLSRKKGASIHK